MYIGSKDTTIIIIHPDALDIVEQLAKILGPKQIKKIKEAVK